MTWNKISKPDYTEHFNLLQEDGKFILQEDGYKLQTELLRYIWNIVAKSVGKSWNKISKVTGIT